jgi:hypothetical protein
VETQTAAMSEGVRLGPDVDVSARRGHRVTLIRAGNSLHR